ncbi:MAG: hypothetical protein IH621_05170 [Krumholzibacteria bacterium]|nr:hypothetical protein [Candidatus Krumholzibacteria bacterium]
MARVVLLVPVLAGVLSGCLQYDERIRVAADGAVDLEVMITGPVASYGPAAGVPGAPGWLVEVLSVDNTGKDQPERHLRCRRAVAPGDALPSGYVDPAAAEGAAHLRFPTGLRTWTTGGRTFYEFRRTYEARRFRRFANAPLTPDQKQLEERILEVGIFAVGAADREAYLGVLRQQLEEDMATRVTEAAGALAADGVLPVAAIDGLCAAGRGFTARTVPVERLLEMLEMDDDSMARALADYNIGLRDALAAAAEGLAAGAGPRLRAELAALDRAWDITLHLGNDSFKVQLDLPGRVIRTNGLSRPDQPGQVTWEFNGKDLQDRDLPLQAVSVVEAPGHRGTP